MSGCHFEGNNTKGLFLQGAFTEDNIIAHNIFIENGVGNTTTNAGGINANGVGRNTYYSNTLVGNKNGIVIDNATYESIIYDNDIRDSLEWGIRIISGTGNVIKPNTFKNNTLGDILDLGTNTVFEGMTSGTVNEVMVATSNTSSESRSNIVIDNVGRSIFNVGGFGSTYDGNAQASGTLHIANASGGVTSPVIASKVASSVGLYVIAGNDDANTIGDMYFRVQENDATDYTTFSGRTAYSFNRFTTNLMNISRDGDMTVLGAITASNVVGNNTGDQDLSGKQDNISLTTTGSSGAATFDGTTLNIPNYVAGGVNYNKSLQNESIDFTIGAIHIQDGTKKSVIVVSGTDDVTATLVDANVAIGDTIIAMTVDSTAVLRILPDNAEVLVYNNKSVSQDGLILTGGIYQVTLFKVAANKYKVDGDITGYEIPSGNLYPHDDAAGENDLPNVTNWDNAFGGTIVAVETTVVPVGETNAVSITTNTATDGSAYASISIGALEVGVEHTLTIDVHRGTTPSASIYLQNNGGGFISNQSIPSASWSTLTFVFTPTQANVDLLAYNVGVESIGDVFYIDKIVITK